MTNRQDNISDQSQAIIETQVLAQLQAGLCISSRPFQDMAGQVGLELETLLSIVDKLFSDNILREISPVFSATGLGYVSTLCAVAVAEDRAEQFVRFLDSQSGVSHNYGRDNAYNIWFTLALPDGGAGYATFEPYLLDLKTRFGLDDIISLPVVKMYKLKVRFGSGDYATLPYEPKGALSDKACLPYAMSELEKAVIIELQKGIPVCEMPFAVVAERVNGSSGLYEVTEQIIVSLLNKWREHGILRRIAGRVRHVNLGYSYNAMLVFDMAGMDIDRAGRAIAPNEFVSHCYHRRRLPQWQYDLYVMLHACSQDMLNQRVDQVIRQVGSDRFCVLPTVCEYKKQSARYFLDK